jgi:hypothetical protein
MFYARFGANRIQSENLSDIATRAATVAMLACLGLAFSSLFDRPASSSYSSTGELWKSFGMVGSALLFVVVACMAVFTASRHRRLGRDELVTAELTLRVDRAEGVVHVSERGQLMTHRIGAGRLMVDVAPYETDSAVRAGLVFRQWPAASSLAPETAAKGVAHVLTTDVYINTAKAIRAWLRRHPGIELDADVVRMKWQQAVDGMVRHARAQLPPGKVAVESFVPYDGPSLDYLAIMSDGRVFTGVGEETLVEHVTRPLLSDGGRRIRVELGDFRPSFVLGPDQISVVQRLHGKGLLTITNEAL